MRWIVARSLRFRWLAVFGAAAVMVFGFIQAREAPLDVFPEFAPPIVEVQTIALGNTSKEVEEFVTIPIEDSLNGVEGLDKVRSYSVEQLSSIKLYFKRGSDLYRPATFVDMAIDNLMTALLLGVLLVILILAAFLFEWRTAFISLLAIPLSLIGALMVLELFDTVINVMILAGLVVSTFRVILDASVEVRSAIIYATLIDVVAIVPVFFLSGLSGAFFQPLVLAYGLAVLVSMLVATTVTPALCFLLLSKGYREKESPLMRALKGGYGWLLARVMSRPGPAVVTAGLVMGAGLLIFPTLGQSLLPNFKENDLITYWATKPGTSLPETMRIANRGCRDYLKEVPAIDSCASHAGQALLGDEIHGVNFDEQWIHFKDGIDYDKSVAQIRGVIDSYPGLYRTVQTYLRERVKEVLSGANESIVVRTFGPDINVLEKKAEEIVARMSTVDGVIDAQVEQIEQIPQIQIQVKPEAARRHGITAGLVRRDSSALIASEEVGDLFYGGPGS